MLLPHLYDRGHGKPPRYDGVRQRLNLSSHIERLHCTALDEHHIDGHDSGELIPPLACSFSNGAPSVLAVADEDGGVLLLDTEQEAQHAVLQSWRAHENAVFDIDWGGSTELLTASGDQSVVLWDAATETAISTFRGHSSSVKTVRFRSLDNLLFVSGSRDGHVMLWDRRMRSKDGHISPVSTIHNAHAVTPAQSSAKKRRKTSQAGDSQQSVTAVIFQDDQHIISSGSVDGSVKVWDLRRTYTGLKSEPMPQHRFLYAGGSVRSHGFSSLVLDSSGTRLFAACMDNIVYQYNAGNLLPSPVACYRGYVNHSFYVKIALSPGDLYLLSGSTDHNGYIWRVDDPLVSPFLLKGHRNEVSAVAWCPTDFTKVVTMSDDSCVRIWRAFSGRQAVANDSDTIGTCECQSKEIGVGVALFSPRLRSTIRPQTGLLASPLSPRPGSVLPTATVPCLSSAAHSSLIAMGAGSPLRPTLTSPSITKWFPRTPASILRSPSPVKSPRRLHVLLSPRAQPIPSPSAAVQTLPRKRKLCEVDGVDEIDNTSSKQQPDEKAAREMICSPLRENGYNITNNSSGIHGGLLSTSVTERTMVTRCQKKLEFGCENRSPGCIRGEVYKTPIKSENSVAVFSSPTVDLPNLVADRSRVAVSPLCERSPRVRHPSGGGRGSADWLTQLGIESVTRRECRGESSKGVTPKRRHVADSVSPCAATPRMRTPRRAARTASCTPDTPGSRRRASRRLSHTPTQGQRCIQQYFPPRTTRSPSKVSPSKQTGTPLKVSPLCMDSPQLVVPRTSPRKRVSPIELDDTSQGFTTTIDEQYAAL